MSVLTTQTNTKNHPNSNQIQAVDSNLMPLSPTYVGPQVEPQAEMSLTDVFGILNKRKWTILLTLLSILALVAWFTFSTDPTYRANATIQIEREGAEIVDFGRTQKSIDSASTINDPFFRTRYEILRGRVVAQEVIDKLSLQESLAPPKSKSMISSLLESVGLSKTDENPEPEQIDYISLFSKNLSVQPITGSHLVEIFYEAPSAQEAKDVVSTIIESFITSQIESKSETGEFAKKFLDEQIIEAGERLQADELSLVERSMEADFKAAKRQEDKIRAELKQFNSTMQDLQDSGVDYNNLKRKVDNSNKLYSSLLQRREEVNVASQANVSSISIVEPAITPIGKYRPRPKVNMLVGLLAGLIFGLALAFLREALDKSVKSSDDLVKLTGLPILGMIPRVTKSKIKKQLDMIAYSMPQSAPAEAYRILATNIRLMFNPLLKG